MQIFQGIIILTRTYGEVIPLINVAKAKIPVKNKKAGSVT